MTPDPRIEAVARVVAVPVHAYTDRATADGGRIPWDCDGCRELAAEVLAAADAVDPLRAPDVIHSIGGANRATERAHVSQGGNYVHNTPESRRVWPDD